MSTSTRWSRSVGKTSNEVNSAALLVIEQPCKYREGDRVFAKVGADPPWPAQVNGIWSEETSHELYHVTFYGTQKSCLVDSESVWPYGPETILKYGTKSHGSPAGFKQAMKEIEDHEVILISDPFESPSKEKTIMKGKEVELGIEVNVEEYEGNSVYEVSNSKISSERDHDCSTAESSKQSLSSKNCKISLSPTPTPSESSGNDTSISMDTEVNDQDFGSTGDKLGHGARPTSSSSELPPRKQQGPFMMNDFRSRSQSVIFPPSAFGPGMASSMYHGWNNNFERASGHNYQPYQQYPPYPPYPPMNQPPNPFHFNPPPYCKYNTATLYGGWHGYGPPHNSSYNNPYQYQHHPYQHHPANWGPGPCAGNPTWLEPGPDHLQSRPLARAGRMLTPMLTQHPVTSPGLFQQIPIRKESKSSTSSVSALRGPESMPTKQSPQRNLDSPNVEILSSDLSVKEVTRVPPCSVSVIPASTVTGLRPKNSRNDHVVNFLPNAKSTKKLLLPSPSPSSSNITFVFGHEEHIQPEDGQQQAICAPMLQQPEENGQEDQLLLENNPSAVVIRASIRNRMRAAAKAATASAAAATAAERTSRSRRSLAQSAQSCRTAGKAAFVKNSKKTNFAAKVKSQKLGGRRATGFVFMKKRQMIERLYDEFTLDCTENTEGVPKTKFKCIVEGCEEYVTRWPKKILKHICRDHLKGETDERSGKIYVPPSSGKNKGKLFMCNFQGCQVKKKEQTTMAKHTYVHLKKTVDCSNGQCNQKFLYTGHMRQHVETDHIVLSPSRNT